MQIVDAKCFKNGELFTRSKMAPESLSAKGNVQIVRTFMDFCCDAYNFGFLS